MICILQLTPGVNAEGALKEKVPDKERVPEAPKKVSPTWLLRQSLCSCEDPVYKGVFWIYVREAMLSASAGMKALVHNDSAHLV